MFLNEKINLLPIDTRKEFYLSVLDNYHCCEDINEATDEFIRKKLHLINGNRIKPKPSSFVWEIRNNNRRTT